jgi:hypothetical protein
MSCEPFLELCEISWAGGLDVSDGPAKASEGLEVEVLRPSLFPAKIAHVKRYFGKCMVDCHVSAPAPITTIAMRVFL